MHYIIGEQLSIPDYTQATVHTGVTQVNPRRAPGPEIKKFKPRSIYTLYNIQKTEEKKFMYTFTGDQGDTVQLEFDSPGHGDAFISSAKGEELPNYSKFYEGRSD